MSLNLIVFCFLFFSFTKNAFAASVWNRTTLPQRLDWEKGGWDMNSLLSRVITVFIRDVMVVCRFLYVRSLSCVVRKRHKCHGRTTPSNGIHLFFLQLTLSFYFSLYLFWMYSNMSAQCRQRALTEAHRHVLFILPAPFVYLSCMSCDVAPLFSPISHIFALIFLLMVLATTWTWLVGA